MSEALRAFRRVLSSFDCVERDVDFVRVTDIYQCACYGAKPVSQEEYEDVVGYYRAFFKNAYVYSGKLRRAFFRFWRV